MRSETLLLTSAIAFACCASASADRFPIVNVRYGYPIGANASKVG